MAVGSLAEMSIALACCCAAGLMYCTWASGLAVCGPTWEYLPPMASTAVLPPESLASKYGLPRFFGMNTTFSGLLEPEAVPPEDDDPVDALLRPVRASATDRVAAPIKTPRLLK